MEEKEIKELASKIKHVIEANLSMTGWEDILSQTDEDEEVVGRTAFECYVESVNYDVLKILRGIEVKYY